MVQWASSPRTQLKASSGNWRLFFKFLICKSFFYHYSAVLSIEEHCVWTSLHRLNEYRLYHSSSQTAHSNPYTVAANDGWSTREVCAEHDARVAYLLHFAHVCVSTKAALLLQCCSQPYLSTRSMHLIITNNDGGVIFPLPLFREGESKIFSCLWHILQM